MRGNQFPLSYVVKALTLPNFSSKRYTIPQEALVLHLFLMLTSFRASSFPEGRAPPIHFDDLLLSKVLFSLVGKIHLNLPSFVGGVNSKLKHLNDWTTIMQVILFFRNKTLLLHKSTPFKQ